MTVPARTLNPGRIDPAPTAADPAVIGSIGGAPIAPNANAPRRGRKTKAEAEANPVTVYRLSNGTWKARWTHPRTKERKHYVVRDGEVAVRSQARALAIAKGDYDDAADEAARVAAGQRARHEIVPAVLGADYLAYLETADISDAAALDAARHMELWLEHTPLGTIEDIRLVDGPMLHQWSADLLKRVSPPTLRQRKDGTWYELKPARLYTRGMVRAHLGTLSAWYSWIARYRLRIANAVQESGVLKDFPKGGRGEDHLYLPHEVVRLLDTADAYPYSARSVGNREILYTEFYTGARIGEILKLFGRDIDWQAGTLTLSNSKRTKKEKAAGRRKGRTVRMWPVLRSVLWEYVQKYGIGPDDPLFPEFRSSTDVAAGKPARPRARAPYDWLQQLCERAGVPYRGGTHVGRHTYVSIRSRMIDRKEVLGQPGVYTDLQVSFEQVQFEIGHRRGSTVTRDVYDKARMELGDVAAWILDYRDIAAEVERKQRMVNGDRGDEKRPAM